MDQQLLRELEQLARKHGVAIVVIAPNVEDVSPPKQRRQRRRIIPSHGMHRDEVEHWLRQKGICFAWLFEVHYEDVRKGLMVPDLSEQFIQTLPEDRLIPVESFDYMRINLRRIKAIGALPRPRWDDRTKRRVRTLRRSSLSALEIAYQLRNETGHRFTSGTIKGACRRMKSD